MKRIFVFLHFLLLMQHVSAQEPPHLEPVTITEMVPVKIDFDKESQQSGSLFLQPDTNYRFTECRNAEGTVGYLIEAKDCVFLVGILLGHQFEDCCEVGLQDVQRAETMLAKVLDRRADSAQIIQRAFTAPYFYQYIEQHPDAIENLSDVYLTLSLGLEYEGRHHKLIAAIIIPSEVSAINDPFVILQDYLREKSTRQFTSKERRACKRCFAVPTQGGHAVCMKMRDGKEQFITIDEGCQVESWQIVNLKEVSLVIYEDADGNEVKRIRIIASATKSIFRRFISFFFR